MPLEETLVETKTFTWPWRKRLMTLARSTMSKLEERTPTEWPWLWRAVATVLAVSRRLQKTIAWPAPIMPWGGGFSGTKK